MTRGNLKINLAKLSEIDEEIKDIQELYASARDRDDEDPQEVENLRKQLREKHNETSARLEVVSTNERVLRSQINRIKETINRMLEKDVTLRDKIKTLFREWGVTIVSILTAISLAISTVASIVASVRPIPTPTPPTPGSGGVKEWIEKTQKSIQLAKETRIKSIGRITRYHRRSIELVIVVSFQQSGRMARGARLAEHVYLFVTGVGMMVIIYIQNQRKSA